MKGAIFRGITVSWNLGITCEPQCEENGLWGFRPSPTQTGLDSNRRLEAGSSFGFKKNRDCTTCICEAKTKALISCAFTAQLICAFVFPYVKIRFSGDEAQVLY